MTEAMKEEKKFISDENQVVLDKIYASYGATTLQQKLDVIYREVGSKVMVSHDDGGELRLMMLEYHYLFTNRYRC